MTALNRNVFRAKFHQRKQSAFEFAINIFFRQQI